MDGALRTGPDGLCHNGEMLRFALVVAGILSPALLFAQSTSNSVTVTASQNVIQQPDQAVFGIFVTATADKSLDDIVSALAGSGITAASLVGITTPAVLVPLGFQPQPMLQWTFRLVVPLSKVKDTTSTLATLQQSVAKADLSLSFAVQGTQVSSQAAPNCNFGDLITQARTQAQKLAGAGGLSSGAIIGITNAVPVCSLTVRFALGLMLGQPGPYAITITASRALNLQPDQVLFGINVNSGLSSNLDDVTGALQAAGVSGASFSGVNTMSFSATNGTPTRAYLQWTFTLAAPLPKLKDTIGLLSAAQQNMAKQGSGLSLSFQAQGLQVSPQLQQSQSCLQTDLMADARGQAQRVATAAGVSAGSIVSMSDGSSPAAGIPTAAFRSGDFIGIIGASLGSFLFAPPPPTYGCFLTVQFQLGN
jgi:uncharacterized protein YggE